MKIGPYQIDPVETGRFGLDGGAMFGVVPMALWAKTNPPDARNRIALAARAMLVRGNGRTILVDCGNGSKFTPKQADIYALDTGRYEIGRSLARLGLSAADITDVVLTHLHFDHAGGSTVRDGNELVPAFPQARYYVQRAHWEQAMHPTEKDRGSFMPDDYMPLVHHRRLEFVDGADELFPGFRFVVTNGHTAAQQLPLISDGTTTLLYCCDLLPTVSHIPLPYIMAYDLRPLVTLEEKKRILGSACEQRWILFFEHDPDVTAGTLAQGERGIQFAGALAFD